MRRKLLAGIAAVSTQSADGTIIGSRSGVKHEADPQKLAPEPHGVLAAAGETGVQVVEVGIKNAWLRPAQAMARELLGEGAFGHGGTGPTPRA